MSQFFNQVFLLLNSTPGNLIYHIVLVFSIAGTLLGVIHLLRTSQIPQIRRTVFGLGILLGLQVILFVASGLVLRGLLDLENGSPPDRPGSNTSDGDLDYLVVGVQ